MEKLPLKNNFIQNIIEEDLKTGKHQNIITRFPPEPNGYLHIGHAKSICLNFGLAKRNNGKCHLRFDDTNPEKEEEEYVTSIIKDIKWLGFDWGKNLYYASDYYDQLYNWAIYLIEQDKAYVCDLTLEEIREHRGTLKSPGKNSPYRERSIEENIQLFIAMKNGNFADGEKVLRAKIDMNSSNLNLRDPVLYRIKKAHHPRTGDTWKIYPMYDFTHGQSDAIEGITHSICTLEFEDHRPLYEWFLNNLPVPTKPRQIEFARLNITYTVMSKRKLFNLVKRKIVTGWDDPRMPTLSGMRRRGYTPEAIRTFCNHIGVSKTNSMIDIELLHHFLREHLNKTALRVMAVINPIKIIILNYPADQEELLDADNNPEDPISGKRQVPFSREIYIEKEDFREDPPRKFHRLSLGKEIRLKHAYYIKCKEVIKDKNNEILEIHCTYDPKSRGGWTDDGRKVKGTSHWVSAKHAIKATARIYDHLFSVPCPEESGSNYLDKINPNSLTIKNIWIEPSLKNAKLSVNYQFLRKGYYCLDIDSTKDTLIFNNTISLKDSWAKLEKR